MIVTLKVKKRRFEVVMEDSLLWKEKYYGGGMESLSYPSVWINKRLRGNRFKL